MLKNTVPFIFALFLLSPVVLFSQPIQQKKHRCGTQTVLENEYKKNPALKSLVAKERAKFIGQSQQNALSFRNNNTNLTIPVVVHVVLPANINGLVTDAQIQAQIDVLNTDFAGLNADSTRIPAAFKSRYGKGRIRFCLAKRTPNGQSTSGIVRVISDTKSNPGPGDQIKYTSFGGSDAWNPQKYLNIWVGDDITGTFLGYTYTPSVQIGDIPLQERGFVNQYKCFGKGGTAEAPFNLGRTAVHEIGHFFNLEHIWGPTNCDGSDNCIDDDGVNDTPIQEKCNYGAPAASSVITDLCTATSPGIMWMNYMDYVDDMAMVMFTPQQHSRMEATFISIPWMQNLANTDGCTPLQTFERDAAIMGINNPVTSYNSTILYSCTSNFQPVIKVRNAGTTAINSLRVDSKINNSTPFITNWNGTLLPNAETDITLSGIALNNGTNLNLSIEITQVNSLSDQNVSNNLISAPGVIFPAILSLPYSEGFEQSAFPPSNWRLFNPNNDTTWARTTEASRSGIGSMVMNNFYYEANGLSDWMFSPLIPAKGRDSIFLSFDIAAATFRTPSAITDNLADTLQILVADNCSSISRNIYTKAGLNLVTTGDIKVEIYFIPNALQWRKDSLFVGYYDNTGPEYLQVAFRNITNYENNIYIDNVQFYNRQRSIPTSVADINRMPIYIKAFPNPFNDQIVIEKDERLSTVPYRIVNVFGQQIISGMLRDKKQVIGAGQLSAGVYFLHVNNVTIKLIKK